MKDVVLDESEHVVASLVPDDPEQLYKHKNQIAAITNKRLLFVRYIGISRSFEGSYRIDSIDIRSVDRVRHVARFAIGGLLAGIILLLTAIGVAFAGATGQLIGPGVIFIPLVAIPSGICLIFGLKRRVLVFETRMATYKWMSDPFAFRKTKEIAASACQHFDAPRHAAINGTESWLAEQSPATAISDGVLLYHVLVSFMLPYVGLPWGIVNLYRNRRKSGLTMLIISSIFLLVILLALICAPRR